MSVSASPTPRPTSRQQPIDEAVTHAFEDANVKNTHAISPDLIEEITKSVIQKLQTSGLENLTQPSQTSPPAPPPPQHETLPAPLSPSTTNSTSPTLPNRVLTPPSPHRQAVYLGPAETVTSPQRSYPQANLSPNRPSSPTSQSECSDGHADRTSRPRGPERLHTGLERTTLEKIWGSLFDEQGRPTARLSQFLRGLAIHLIEDFEPRHSLVVTPRKMAKFYETVNLRTEVYPWNIVFDDELTSISRLYRALSCNHHLVQEYDDERPDIPGLTPKGFEKWVTLLIQANPEAEYERLAKALLHMPIDNPDDRKERFPKEVTRRLFPTHADLGIRYRVEDAMMEHASIDIPRPKQPNQDDAKDQQASSARRAQSVSFAEPEIIQEPEAQRPPPPKQNLQPKVSEDIDSAETAAKPIERERKPYVAQPGKGRMYETEDPVHEPYTRPRHDSMANDFRPAHSRPIPINPNIQQMPKPEIHQSYKEPGTDRRRSPSFGQSGDYRRPDLDGHNSYRPTLEASSLPRNSSAAPPVFDEADTKRYFENQARDRARRKADEDVRAYGESPRRHGSLKPKRTDYANDDDYWRAREKRDRSYDDEGGYR